MSPSEAWVYPTAAGATVATAGGVAAAGAAAVIGAAVTGDAASDNVKCIAISEE